MAFRSSQKVIAEMVYELRKVGTSRCSIRHASPNRAGVIPFVPACGTVFSAVAVRQRFSTISIARDLRRIFIAIMV
jgi:hypothetical protein